MNHKSLYIHIPFCLRKCLFCSFAIAVGQDHRKEDYVEALIKEMKSYEGVVIDSIYLGGGTPSTLSEEQLGILIDEVRTHFSINKSCEITMESNPEDITLEKLKAIASQGIKRLSIGVQSFDDRYLKFLGRAHNSTRAKDAFRIAKDAGFTNISGDLMYGFPGQTKDELLSDIEQMMAQGVTHVSIYTLTIEPNSRFYAQAVKLDDENKLADHYQMIINRLALGGYKQYEVSNFAKEGYQSQHNRHYWLGHEYIGLGMGAHGYIDGKRYWNHDRLNIYLDAVMQGKAVQADSETLSEETQLKEKLIFGLRMNQGVDENSIWPNCLEPLRGSLLKEIATLVEGGFLVRDNNYLKVTDKGRMVLDEIAVKLV